MPIRENKISIDFDPYIGIGELLSSKQVKDIDYFKRCYFTAKHCYARYIATCSKCLDKSVK